MHVAGDHGASPATSVQVLRARQYFANQLSQANSENSPQSLFRHRISITFCSVLLEQLFSGLDSGLSLINTQLQHLRLEGEGSAEEEELLALQAKLLFRHSHSKTASKPSQMRSLLEDAIERFPNNSIFLSLYLSNEMRTKIEGRVRRLLEDKILKEGAVTTQGWLFAIYAELHMNARSYNVQSVRALFERAVDAERCTFPPIHSVTSHATPCRTLSSVSIWLLYIELEVKQGDLKRAKGLLQRAIVQCPWSKGDPALS